ncbi:MAG TPA: porin [Dongiaceae bacterium]|nr:porin [Dongiaceae bacterium]
MRRSLLGSTALVGAGLASAIASQPAGAADGIILSIGGYFRTAYMVVFDDDGEGEAGNEHNTDGIFSDAEIHFTGSTVLDNGLEVGARVELEGEDESGTSGDAPIGGDQIDEAWIYFSGGFGEVRIGSLDDALGDLCVFAPGGTTNFSAFSPNQWGANTLTSNSICFGVDDVGDSQKIVYFSPVFGGFQLGLSYVPSSDKETHGDGVGAHLGMPANVDGFSRHNVSLYGVYNYEAEDWWLQVGAGGSWEGNVEKTDGGPNREESEFYQTGILVGIGAFQVGASFNYFNDDDLFVATQENGDVVADRWVLGIGASYTLEEVWTFGIGYSLNEADIENEGGEDSDFTLQRAALTVNYNLGPGIDLDGEVAYTWQDVSGPDFDEAADDYDALELGIGTAITF